MMMTTTTNFYFSVSSILTFSLVTASRRAAERSAVMARKEGFFAIHPLTVPQRKLNDASVPLSAFCSQTSDLEAFLANALVQFYSVLGDTVMFLDDEPFLCLCLDNTQQQTLTLECRARYLFEFDPPFAVPIVSVETMTLEAQDAATGVYVPTSVSWREYNGVSLGEPEWASGESYTVSIDDAGALILDTCTIFDPNCSDAVCGVCEGGATSFRQDPICFNVTCDEAQTNVDIFAYYQSTGITVQRDILIGQEDCSVEGPFVEDFCTAENLQAVAQDMTDSYKQWVEPALGTTATRGYECRCTDVAPLIMTCDLLYVLGGDPVEYTNTETLTYATEGIYQVATTMQWCDTGTTSLNGEALYCETFALDLLQQNVARCTVDGCQTPFCSLCPDGSSLAFTCGDAGATCDENYTGSLWEFHRANRLAVQKCVATVLPTQSTTEASPTQAPTEASPTQVSPTEPLPTKAPSTGTPTTPRGPTSSTTVPRSTDILLLFMFVFFVYFAC
eukprot:scaffold1878_cov170-Amphora_coffeaeformis.AAC.13